MKKILFVFAAVLVLSSCINEDGIYVNMPSSLMKQWMTEDTDGEDTWITILDFTSRPGHLSFVYFDSMLDLDTFPQYYAYDEYSYGYKCRKKGEIYTILLSDEESTKYYFTDITSTSVIVTTQSGEQWNFTPCHRKITAVPVDY